MGRVSIVIPHNIGDKYYGIKADDNLKPEIIELGNIDAIYMYERIKNNDQKTNMVHYVLKTKDEIDEVKLSESEMKQNLWFFEKAKAKKWLSDNFKPENYKLKIGDKLKCNMTNEIYTVKELKFGGLYDNGSSGIRTLDSWSIDHSYKEYFPMLENAWYFVTDTHYNMFVLIGTGTDNDPYRIDYIPCRHNVLQFQKIVTPII